MDAEIGSLLIELQELTEGLKPFGTVEAAMRLRALSEIASRLSTDALLELAMSVSEQPGEARRAQAA